MEQWLRNISKMVTLLIGMALVALAVFYYSWVSVYDKWTKRGIPSYPAKFPFGSSSDVTLMRKFIGEGIDRLYKKMKEHPYFGIFIGRSPTLVVTDPEIIKLVLAKEFSHFRDRMPFKKPKNDPLSHHLFHLTGETWRALRVKLSPTFTSGKIKAMYPLFVECASALNDLIVNRLGDAVDIKDVAACFNTDVICSCAFGLETNSVKNPNNELRVIGSTLLKMSKTMLFIQMLMRMLPTLAGRRKFTRQKTEDYILKLIGDTVEYREKNNIKRDDFLDLLIQLKNQGKIGEDTNGETKDTFEMDLGLMAAQCFVFFIAGFETSSSVMTFCLYELALNQDIQNKLREDINKTLERHGGELTYQAIKEMDYLDMAIKETMRKYPTVPNLMRMCTKTITLPDGKTLEEGDRLLIPLWSIQRDQRYFPDPLKFDPERFSSERSQSIRPYTYMPFGEGPRICIGNRFGLLQTKVGLLTMMRNFEVLTCEETTIPVEFPGNAFLTSAKGPIKLKFAQIASA